MKMPWQKTPDAEFTSLDQLLQEATQSVEQQLNIEDQGWTTFGVVNADTIPDSERIANLRASRLYYTRDPLAKQAVRLWTDYTFGSGMNIDAGEDETQKVLDTFWRAPINRSVLGARGQRKSSDKLLVDGEVFFVLWLGLGGSAVIRWVDPLEIVNIITEPEDVETPMYYHRRWVDTHGQFHDTVYRSSLNMGNRAVLSAQRKMVTASDDGIVFHLPYNTISQRGNPLILPALDWLRQYRRFLAARVAIMLALTRFAWSVKVKGGASAVAAVKSKIQTEDEPADAGSFVTENEGVDTKPIKADTGAKNAYEDGRMLKLQIAAATGLSEQYFGDISTGNLATAKTVELPMVKMFSSLQKVWEDFYNGINEMVMIHNKVSLANQYVDVNWPLIAPKDIQQASQAIMNMVTTFPAFGESQAVQTQALTILGIDDTPEVLAALKGIEQANPEAKFARALRGLIRTLEERNNGHRSTAEAVAGTEPE